MASGARGSKAAKKVATRFFDDELAEKRLKQYLSEGVSPREALIYFVSKSMAFELFALEDAGYGEDYKNVESLWTPSEQGEQGIVAHHRFKRIKVSLETELIRKLISGSLVAEGYSSNDGLDVPRRKLDKPRWEELELDLDNSSADGSRYNVTQILIFDPSGDVYRATSGYPEFSPEALRSWYLERIVTLKEFSETTSKVRDVEDADQHFGTKVPRKLLEAHYEELMPANLKRRRGRPRKIEYD